MVVRGGKCYIHLRWCDDTSASYHHLLAEWQKNSIYWSCCCRTVTTSECVCLNPLGESCQRSFDCRMSVVGCKSFVRLREVKILLLPFVFHSSSTNIYRQCHSPAEDTLRTHAFIDQSICWTIFSCKQLILACVIVVLQQFGESVGGVAQGNISGHIAFMLALFLFFAWIRRPHNSFWYLRQE